MHAFRSPKGVARTVIALRQEEVHRCAKALSQQAISTHKHPHSENKPHKHPHCSLFSAIYGLFSAKRKDFSTHKHPHYFPHKHPH